MNLSAEQQTAVVAGEPIALQVAGTECVLVRKDIFLRLSPQHGADRWMIDEMNHLADEVDEMLTRKEYHVP